MSNMHVGKVTVTNSRDVFTDIIQLAGLRIVSFAAKMPLNSTFWCLFLKNVLVGHAQRPHSYSIRSQPIVHLMN